MSDRLNIIHFSTADNVGGSGRSAYRIHTGLRDLGHCSRMLVGQKTTVDPDVETVHGGGFGRIKDRIADELTRRAGLQYLYYPSGKALLRHAWTRNADLFQIYNTHGGYFSHRILPRLSRMAPIVWRLSDMWAMTGHCAYSGGCERWRTGCGACPDLDTYPPLAFDTSAFLWKMKARLYRHCNITVVAPSSWTERLAKESPLLGQFDVHRIPNGLDTEIFRPHNKRSARELLNIDPEANVILFCAHALDDNPRKGGEFLIDALNRLEHVGNTVLVLAGFGGESWRAKLRIPVQLLGSTADDRIMAAAYSAADVVAVPSVVENLPNTVLEAMACGTPAVAFDAGGMGDAVKHMKTGYLVEHGDISGLVNGLGMMLRDRALRDRLGESACDLVSREFNKQVQAKRFAGLYTEILAKNRRTNELGIASR